MSTPVSRAQIAVLFDLGKSITDISTSVGCTPETVRATLSKLGLTSREYRCKKCGEIFACANHNQRELCAGCYSGRDPSINIRSVKYPVSIIKDPAEDGLLPGLSLHQEDVRHMLTFGHFTPDTRLKDKRGQFYVVRGDLCHKQAMVEEQATVEELVQ
jgi:ribosomal protein S27AE